MGSPTRHVCIHGHFYQPPRENPWIEAIEIQDSAAPFHDWNERIEAECYAPNAAARILDERGRIARLVNNYSRISFNVGPTLLSWMEAHAPETYAALIEADRESVRRHGHGSALAQAYGHAILPLCNERDRRTQVAWGVADFRRRFGRDPDGMWLPETAVDLPTLETLADHGIRFTVLAPSQAARFRAIGGRAWRDAARALDPRVPYRVGLPSGRSVAVFFYDGALSRAVAFERLLDDGAALVERIRGAFDPRDTPQLVHLATDGETFGHHHRFGEMALAFALDRLERAPDVRLTHYAAYLEAHPPVHEAEIVERTAWSCAHGLGRWSADCGCSSGAHPGWTQAWRAPLRAALDEIRDDLAHEWERVASTRLRDPWAARDAYVDLVLDRSPSSVDRFVERHAVAPGGPDARRETLELLELQRAMLLAYTSCGWFFDDVSGIETVQILQYAARALDLARDRLRLDLEPRFLERLAAAPSNVPEWGHARAVYERAVRPARIDVARAAAQAAVAAMFDGEPGDDRSTCFVFETSDWRVARAGRPRHVSGVVRATDRRTGAQDSFATAAVHLGGANLLAGVLAVAGGNPDGHGPAALADIRAAIDAADVPRIVRQFEATFAGRTVALADLPRDLRRHVARTLLRDALHDAEQAVERLYRQHAPTLRMLAGSDVPIPGTLRETARFALTASLRRTLARTEPDPADVRERVREALAAGVALDDAGLRREAECALLALGRRTHLRPWDRTPARRLRELVDALTPVAPDLHATRVAVYGSEFPDGDPWDGLLAALGFAPGAGRASDPVRTGPA